MDVFINNTRVQELAERQGGRLAWAQILACGVTRTVAANWIRRGRLIATSLPRIYALGYLREDLEARLWETVLYAGPGACLSGGSAAHRLGLINHPPRQTVVATPRQIGSRPGILVLGRRSHGRDTQPDGMPVALLPDLLIDLAATETYNVLRHAIDALEFQRRLDLGALAEVDRRRPGAVTLQQALADRLPGLSRAASRLEVDFLLLLEANHVPLPEVNARLAGHTVDMFWAQFNLVVELDGVDNHHTAHQLRRDAGRDARLRERGLDVLRLNWRDVHAHHGAAALAALADRAVAH